MYHTNTSCRICGSQDLYKFLDLGNMPPSNSFITKDEIKKENFFPLKVYFCKKCGLVQLLDVVNPNLLFKNYLYYTNSSKVLANHLEDLAKQVVKEYKLDNQDLVIDIGGNDGTLLKYFAQYGQTRCLNVEPSLNHCVQAERKNQIASLNDYFNINTANDILHMYFRPKVITATNVFAHIDDLKSIMKGVKLLLKRNGVFIIEVHHFLNMFTKMEFDQIYHEHLCYFNILPLIILGHQFEFNISKIEKIPMHGGSLRIYYSTNKQSPDVLKFLNEENEVGLYNWFTYKDFEVRIEKIRKELIYLLKTLKGFNKRIVGYGAAAKGNTLLNYCKIGPDILDYITDNTLSKQGKFSPGMHIPIVSKDEFHKNPPDYALLLAWNYKDEILKEEKWFTENGGKFILPIPEPMIL